MKGLAKDREKRFQTGAEMAAALRDPEGWAAKQEKMEAAAEMPTINITAPRAMTTSSSPIVSRPAPQTSAGQAVMTAQPAKPRRSWLGLTLGAVALMFLLFVVSVVGVIWYLAQSTRSASGEVNKAIRDATADIARESADAGNNPQQQQGGSSPAPGTHAEHPESQGPRKVPPAVQPPKPPAAPGEDYGAAETARAMEEANKQLAQLHSQLPQTPQNWNFDPTPLLLQIADQQFKSGNYHAAVKLYGDVLKRDPKNAAAQKGLKRAQEALQKAGPNSR